MVDTEAAQAIVDFAERRAEQQVANKSPAAVRYAFDAVNHVHTLDGKPLMGTSTVVDALAKHLEYWSAEESAVECLEAGTDPCTTIRAELADARKLQGKDKQKAVWAIEKKYPLFKIARRAHAKAKDKAADDGTSTHKALELYVCSCIVENGGEPYKLFQDTQHPAVEVFSDWAWNNVTKFLWSEKHCYSEDLWVGGISDCGCVLSNGNTAIIDFKRKGCYYSQHIQVGGYAYQVQENGLFDSEGNQFMKSIIIDEVIVFPNAGKPVSKPAERYMTLFDETVDIYKEQQIYDN